MQSNEWNVVRNWFASHLIRSTYVQLLKMFYWFTLCLYTLFRLIGWLIDWLICFLFSCTYHIIYLILIGTSKNDISSFQYIYLVIRNKPLFDFFPNYDRRTIGSTKKMTFFSVKLMSSFGHSGCCSHEGLFI